MLGTNDLKFRYSMSATDIANGVRKLVRLIKSKSLYVGGIPKVLVVAPPIIKDSAHLLGDEFKNGVEKSNKMGKELLKAASEEGCPFIDSSSLLNRVILMEFIYRKSPIQF
ncbi:MAG: hypothetical protein HC831_19625 [Chloroflexia bacterium]|nr:hypothetical protein [Chloroflexia bacterium]